MRERIALVTGASSGIGKVTAEALAADGFTVVLAARRREALDAVAKDIAAAGGSARAVAADVGDETSVGALFDAIARDYGRLDVVFNNAGVSPPEMGIGEYDVAEWERVVRINLTGVLLCMRGAFALMKRQDPRGGRIVNNGSISAHMPRPLAAAYTATKHGVQGLTRQGALEGRNFDIAVGQIDIGNAATEMSEKMASGTTQADGSKAAEPRMDARSVADAVVYMANLPLDTNVLTMTVMANAMPYVGRG